MQLWLTSFWRLMMIVFFNCDFYHDNLTPPHVLENIHIIFFFSSLVFNPFSNHIKTKKFYYLLFFKSYIFSFFLFNYYLFTTKENLSSRAPTPIIRTLRTTSTTFLDFSLPLQNTSS